MSNVNIFNLGVGCYLVTMFFSRQESSWHEEAVQASEVQLAQACKVGQEIKKGGLRNAAPR